MGSQPVLAAEIYSRKDAATVSNCPDRAPRSARQDGDWEDSGGLAQWQHLAEPAGLSAYDLNRELHVVPGVRFAVQLIGTSPGRDPGLKSSLIETFATSLMTERPEAFERHYPWVSTEALGCFRERSAQARRRGGPALALVLVHCNTAGQRAEVLEA